MRIRLQSLVLLLVGVLLVSTLGYECLNRPFARGLERLSYDLPFAPRGHLATPEVRLVTMDEKSARGLRQPMDAPWDRALHARLIRALTAAGARAVLFDLVFDKPGEDPEVDAELAAAMRENGHIYLGAAMPVSEVRGAMEEKVIPPIAILRKAAAGWGLLVFRPLDPDFGVRQIFPGTEEVPGATWRMARQLGAPLPETASPAEPARWLNYYGPPGRMARANFEEALKPEELAPDFFRNRIVVVGGGQRSLGNLSQEKDEFMTPYTRVGEPFAGGMEIQATILLNLLRGDWLTRLDPRTESWLVVLLGAGIATLLSVICAFCPFRTAMAAGLVFVGVVAAACWSAWHQRIWFNWLIPAAVQTPAALVWSIGSRYFVETKRRLAIRRAFSLYLSPHMADEIADARFDLKPGGRLVEATVMFTDLEGFTALSERLRDPKEIAEVLIAYFNKTTEHVLDHRGTIIKYVGDAVFATWGAPLDDPDHAYHATLAAWGMHQASQESVHGHHLVTRIGVNTGTVLAGNLGSDFRFDYTLIGDPVNVASRLDGLNKFLGTQVLLAEETFKRVGDRFVVRPLGRFQVFGKTEPLAIYELLGPVVTHLLRETIGTFEQALTEIRAGNLSKARPLLQETRAQRGGRDGPAEFYLERVAEYELNGLPADWDGVIKLTAK